LHNLSKTLLTLALIGGAALAMPLASNAQVLQITISDGTNTFVVTDMSGNDGNTNPNAVSIDTALQTLFPGELQTTSNVTASFSTPGGQARLSTTGDLFAAAGGAGKTWTVTASINNVAVPGGPVRQFTSTDTFSWNLNNGVTTTSTGGTDLANTLNTFGSGSDVVARMSQNNGPNSAAGMGPGFFFGVGTYSITSKTVTFLSQTNAESQYTTTNIVQAVPEPGSMALLAGVGISGSLFALRLRRRRK